MEATYASLEKETWKSSFLECLDHSFVLLGGRKATFTPAFHESFEHDVSPFSAEAPSKLAVSAPFRAVSDEILFWVLIFQRPKGIQKPQWMWNIRHRYQSFAKLAVIYLLQQQCPQARGWTPTEIHESPTSLPRCALAMSHCDIPFVVVASWWSIKYGQQTQTPHVHIMPEYSKTITIAPCFDRVNIS